MPYSPTVWSCCLRNRGNGFLLSTHYKTQHILSLNKSCADSGPLVFWLTITYILWSFVLRGSLSVWYRVCHISLAAWYMTLGALCFFVIISLSTIFSKPLSFTFRLHKTKGTECLCLTCGENRLCCVCGDLGDSYNMGGIPCRQTTDKYIISLCKLHTCIYSCFFTWLTNVITIKITW